MGIETDAWAGFDTACASSKLLAETASTEKPARGRRWASTYLFRLNSKKFYLRNINNIIIVSTYSAPITGSIRVELNYIF